MASDVKLSANLVSFQALLTDQADRSGRNPGAFGRFEKCGSDDHLEEASYTDFY
jgi:hypothetical protein